MRFNRRDFIKVGAASAAYGALQGCAGKAAKSAGPAKVVVVGAGFGGAIAAKYLKMWGGDIDVTLIDRETKFVSCPLSNTVIAGMRTLDDISKSYDGLKKRGINVVNADVTAVDTDKRMVKTSKGDFKYDRVILSPGIEILFDKVQGLDKTAQEKILHAWRAGPQTLALRKQIESMPDGGVIVIGMPLAPYRCPPGPYERVCLTAEYLTKNKPKSKIIMLDANPDIASKKGLFLKAWAPYGSLIEYRPNAKVTKVDATKMIASTEFDDVKADVINIIPPQRAGEVTEMAGVRNASGPDGTPNVWSKVNFATYESSAKKYVHVIGDAILSNYPKSGAMANNMGKVCAAAVIDMLNDREPEPVPVVANTCYSLTSSTKAIHVATVFRRDPEKDAMVAQPGGGVSTEASELELAYADSWAANIWAEMFD